MGGDLTKRINVTLNMHGQMKDFYPDQPEQLVVPLEKPETLAVLLKQLGIHSKIILFATIDDRIVDKQHLIDRSCVVNIFSPPAGG
jgi:sulfur carrier protein ThiS